MAIIESDIKLDLPATECFRFEVCPAYRSIQQNFKEMDAGWYDGASNTLYLIELKDWTRATLRSAGGENINKRVNDLVKKSVDSACMIVAILMDTNHGQSIANCFPFRLPSNVKLKFISIVHCSPSDELVISNINTQYKTKFASYAKLFDIASFFVISRSRAMNAFSWVQIP